MQPQTQRPVPMNHTFNPTLFREYDIRGVVGRTLAAEDAYYIARAFAVKAAGQADDSVCVGRDGRLSSPALHAALCKGLIDGGLNVIDVGIGPTPMLYFAAKTQKALAGIMVTGSHNPPDHNGFKFVLRGAPFFGADITSLKALGEHAGEPTGQGKISVKDVSQAYLDTLWGAYRAAGLSVAWDAGNGATGDIMAVLTSRLPGRHYLLNEKIDGTFPAHHPDPTVPENLEQLIHEVLTRKLDAGIAFDGDGDRLGVVDDEGEILWGDQLLMLYAAEVLKERPGATIIADVKASGALFEEVTRLGGVPLMWKTGHSLIKQKMAETGSPLAGEMSGHLFFADTYYGYDDGLYAAVRILALFARSGKKLSDLRKALPQRVSTPEIRFECDEARKFIVIDEVKKRLTDAGAEFSPVDGVRVNTPDGWWLLRASNTQAVLVARCEARNADGLKRLQAALNAQLQQSQVALPS